MKNLLVPVVGTGTEIGKTHVACALITALRARDRRVVAWKPVESGVTGELGADEAALREASGTTSAPTLRLREPLSPHLAARREGKTINVIAIGAQLKVLVAANPCVVLELAGGLFSPLDDLLDNADFLASFPHRAVLVAPDRLGVLHDVGATVRAARASGITLEAIVLSPPATPDASTGTNAAELAERAAIDIPIFAVPRGDIATVATALAPLAGRFG